MMRKFLREQELMNSKFPDEMQEIQELIDDAVKQRGTLLQTTVDPRLFTTTAATVDGNPPEINFTKTEAEFPLPPICKTAVNAQYVRKLRHMYEYIYPNHRILHVSSFCQKFKHLLLSGCRYKSHPTDNQQASTVFAVWFDGTKRPAVIREFLSHDIMLVKENGKSERITHILAKVEWFVKHPLCTARYSSPLQIWCNDFESSLPPHANFMPVVRIQESCVSVKTVIMVSSTQKEKVNVIIPLPKSIMI